MDSGDSEAFMVDSATAVLAMEVSALEVLDTEALGTEA